MIQLSATNLHYLGDTEEGKRHDLCVHGDVLFAIENHIVESGGKWCLTASALRFMRSVLSDHFSGSDERMIPCCGHLMIPDQKEKSVRIYGCQNGVDFDVIHEDNRVILRTADGCSFSVDFSEYRSAVLSYSEQVESFIRSSPERIFDDELDKIGYEAFITEWFALKERIGASEHT